MPLQSFLSKNLSKLLNPFVIESWLIHLAFPGCCIRHPLPINNLSSRSAFFLALCPFFVGICTPYLSNADGWSLPNSFPRRWFSFSASLYSKPVDSADCAVGEQRGGWRFINILYRLLTLSSTVNSQYFGLFWIGESSDFWMRYPYRNLREERMISVAVRQREIKSDSWKTNRPVKLIAKL